MSPKYRVLLAMLAGSFLTQPALADSQQDLQQQIKVLQEQLQSIQKQLNAQQAVTKQVQAEVKTMPGVPPGVEVVTVNEKGVMKIGPVTVKLGGFVDLTSIFRSRNENSDIGSTFGGIPFNQVPNAHETESRETARHSRLSLLAQSAWDEDTNLSGYFEGDFVGIGVTSNSGESNSYVPRLRQAYLTVDKASGWHFEAGQAWSLVTGFKDGLVPRDENIPLTVDAQYVPGFNWRRVPQVRLTKTFSPQFSVGLSAESPQASFAGDAPPAANVPELVTTVPGLGSGGGTLNSGQCVNNLGTIGNCANYSVDVAPDVVLKAAFDPGWGHYEVFGLGRIFRTRTGLFAEGQKTTLTSNSLIDFGNNETVGGGVGGNLILPIMPKLLDFQASVLGGRGIGQYGAAQFADFTVNQVGDPSPIPMVQTTVGLVAHANPALDFYAYGGYERAFQDTFALGNTFVGYGSPLDDNTGCNIENSNKFSSALKCTGVNKDVWQLTGGLWDKVYMGKHGTVSLGLQYSYTQRELFDGFNSFGGARAPIADDNMVFAAVRYYPF